MQVLPPVMQYMHRKWAHDALPERCNESAGGGLGRALDAGRRIHMDGGSAAKNAFATADSAPARIETLRMSARRKTGGAWPGPCR